MWERGTVRVQGPAAVLVPLGGFSFSDRPGHAFFDPESKAALIEALRQDLAPGVELSTIDAHINDPIFADAIVAKLREFIEDAR